MAMIKKRTKKSAEEIRTLQKSFETQLFALFDAFNIECTEVESIDYCYCEGRCTCGSGEPMYAFSGDGIYMSPMEFFHLLKERKRNKK